MRNTISRAIFKSTKAMGHNGTRRIFCVGKIKMKINYIEKSSEIGKIEKKTQKNCPQILKGYECVLNH